MEKPIVSIIIPVYNTEKYIANCLQSILNQTRAEFEIILVNDGSTDQSINVANEILEGSGANYKIIHQENKGVSAARNNGIKHSAGEYLLFLDSDDAISKSVIGGILNNDEETDFFFWQYHKVDADGNVQSKVNDICDSFTESGATLFNKISNGDLWIWICSAAFKREVIVKNNLLFPVDFRYGEDLYFIFKYLSIVNKCEFVPGVTSFYNLRENSATKTYSIRQFDSVSVLIYLYDEMIEQGKETFARNLKRSIIPSNFFSVFNLLSLYGKEDDVIDIVKKRGDISSFLESYGIQELRYLRTLLKIKIYANYPRLMIQSIKKKAHK